MRYIAFLVSILLFIPSFASATVQAAASCDGVANDTVAIQTAINNAIYNPGRIRDEVVVPSGICIVDQLFFTEPVPVAHTSVEPPAPQIADVANKTATDTRRLWFHGAGMGVTVLRSSTANGAILQISPSAMGFTFSDFTVQGTGGTDRSQIGIGVNGTDHTFRDIEITSMSILGNDGGTAIYVQNQDSHQEYGETSPATSNGSVGAARLTFDQLWLHGNRREGILVGGPQNGLGSQRVQISGCRVHDNDSHGIDINGSDVVITNNLVFRNDVGITLEVQYGSAENVIVANNSVYRNRSRGINVIGALHNVLINGNWVGYNVSGGATDEAGVLVRDVGADANIAIENNEIVKNGTVGKNASTSAGAGIDGICIDCGSLSETTASEHVHIANNVIVGNKRYGINNARSKRQFMWQNRLSGNLTGAIYNAVQAIGVDESSTANPAVLLAGTEYDLAAGQQIEVPAYTGVVVLTDVGRGYAGMFLMRGGQSEVIPITTPESLAQFGAGFSKTANTDQRINFYAATGRYYIENRNAADVVIRYVILQ